MRVVITGKGSYMGTHIKSWLEQKNEDFSVLELDMLGNDWENFDFSGTYCVIHVAGIVHRKNGEVSKEVYRKVNTELAFNVAKNAKDSGVKNFIFISTMAVYGLESTLPKTAVVNSETECKPYNPYGQSKLDAEKLILSLADDSFNVSVVRPPNVYGKGCPGNYFDKFIKLVKISPVFPNVYENCVKSMIYIDNLTEFIYLLAKNNASGIFCPQDRKALSAVDMVNLIAEALNKKIYMSRFLGFFVKLLGKHISIARKLYGGVAYDYSLSKSEFGDYIVCDDGISKSV